jgi:hypothetical protein
MTSGWEDQRLEAAFAARAASAARPVADLTDLTDLTIERLRREPRPRSTVVRIGGFAGLAAVLAVVVIAVIGIGFDDRGPLASVTPPGTATIGSAGSPGSPGPFTEPASLPAMSVGVAIAERDASNESGEIRVAGWLRGGVPVPCPAPIRPYNPTQPWCPQALPWIVESVADSGVGRLNESPSGPGIQPSFALVDADTLPSLMVGSAPPAAPVEITVTGHFHDRRATLCSSSGDCWGTFVVDRIDSIGGIAQPVTTSYDLAIQADKGTSSSGLEIPRPTGPAEQFDPAVMSQGHRLAVLSRRVMSIGGLIDAEPALAEGWAGIGTATTVTSITAVETEAGSGPPHPFTFLFPDRGPQFYEMTAGGPVVAGDLPTQAFPDLVARVGPALTVSATIERRDHALDATELLVAGWAWAPGSLFCTLIRPGEPVLDQCPSTLTWLADREPPRVKGSEFPRPDGPAINLIVPPESVNLARLDTKPAQVAVLGHFDDRRAAACPGELVERCRRNFIVDEILDPRRLALDATLATTVHPAPSNTPKGTASWAAEAAGLAGTETDRANRLISAFPIAVAALGAVEPDLAETASTAGIDTVWLVHFLDQDVAGNAIVRTRLVIDADPAKGAAQVFDVTTDGMSPALSAAP